MKRSVALLVLCLSACSSTSVSTPAAASFTPLPVLVAGSTYTYDGAFSEAITYASPSPQQPNSLGAYKTVDVETVATAPPGAPAPFEVRRRIDYAATSAPTSGIQPRRRVIDAFESSTVTRTSQTIAQAQTSTKTTGIDRTAGRVEGNGPYAYADASTTVYASPRTLQVFPLAIGSTDDPLARVSTNKECSVNGGGNVYAERNTSTQYADDGSFVETGSIGPSLTTNVKARGDGSASVVNGGASPFKETIGVPIASGGTYHIPVTRVVGGVSTSYLAADWYPGGAAPPSPLASTKRIVVGPATIPSRCGVTVPVSDVQEVDTASETLDVVSATYTVSKSQTFLSNGIAVCRITDSTANAYAIETGLLFSTTVDDFIEGMTATSQGAAVRRP